MRNDEAQVGEYLVLYWTGYRDLPGGSLFTYISCTNIVFSEPAYLKTLSLIVLVKDTKGGEVRVSVSLGPCWCTNRKYYCDCSKDIGKVVIVVSLLCKIGIHTWVLEQQMVKRRSRAMDVIYKRCTRCDKTKTIKIAKGGE